MDDLDKSKPQTAERTIPSAQMESLKHSEAFYYSLVENIPQFIFCKDMKGRFTFVNQRFCNLLEISFEDIIGKTDFDFFPAELAQKYVDDDQRVIKNNETLEDIEANKVSNHETTYVHVVKTPIHDADGKIIGMQGIFWDITKRKKAEEELKNANTRMKHDLVAASKVQRGFIPDRSPDIPDFNFAWLFEPSEYVGGDLLNVFRLDEKKWAFYILDVSGHGVPAALLSVSLCRMLDPSPITQGSLDDDIGGFAVSGEFFDPRKVVRMLNYRFPGDASKFCTLLYAILDTEESSVSWVRAGHEPPLLVKSEDNSTYIHKPGGACISKLLANGQQLEIGRLTLEPGDRFILYSDGITEAMQNSEEFGYERLAAAMRETYPYPLDDSLKTVLLNTARWAGSRSFEDDVTLLALERDKPDA